MGSAPRCTWGPKHSLRKAVNRLTGSKKTRKIPIIRVSCDWRGLVAPVGACPRGTKSAGGPALALRCLFGTTHWLTVRPNWCPRASAARSGRRCPARVALAQSAPRRIERQNLRRRIQPLLHCCVVRVQPQRGGQRIPRRRIVGQRNLTIRPAKWSQRFPSALVLTAPGSMRPQATLDRQQDQECAKNRNMGPYVHVSTLLAGEGLLA